MCTACVPGMVNTVNLKDLCSLRVHVIFSVGGLMITSAVLHQQLNEWLQALITVQHSRQCSLSPPMLSPTQAPFHPVVPCMSIFLNTFLLGQLDTASYQRYGGWAAALVATYLVYGALAAQAQDDRR